MEHINYLYFNGVLQNLHKHLNLSNANQDVLHRAIKTIEDRLKAYETKSKDHMGKRFVHNTF